MDTVAFVELLHDTFGDSRFTPADVIARIGEIPIVIEAMGGAIIGRGDGHRAGCSIGLSLAALAGKPGCAFDASGRPRYSRTLARMPSPRGANVHGDLQVDACGNTGAKRSFVVRRRQDSARRERVKVTPGMDLDAFAADLDRRIADLEFQLGDLRQLSAILQDRIRRAQPRPRK